MNSARLNFCKKKIDVLCQRRLGVVCILLIGGGAEEFVTLYGFWARKSFKCCDSVCKRPPSRLDFNEWL